MLQSHSAGDHVPTASVQYSIVASIFVANITMEPKASGMMSLGIPSLFTQRSVVSTAKSFDGRWTQPRWLRTVFLCVWKQWECLVSEAVEKTALARMLALQCHVYCRSACL